jgi:hypothetical protein
MASSISETPKDDEIFLVALRGYSERCEAPELTPSCPFASLAQQGVRHCGEECMDILGRNAAPEPIEQVVLEDGLTINRIARPRARRKVRSQSSPFDAKEIHLQDSNKGDPPSWRLSALLFELEDLATTAPPINGDGSHERLGRIDDISTLIEARGISIERHLQPWLRNSVANSLIATLRIPLTRGGEVSFANGAEWVKILGGGDKSTSSKGSAKEIAPLYRKVLKVVHIWVQSVSLADLFDWKPPKGSTEALLESEEIQPDVEVGQWIVDRFCRTYLTDWKPSSLRLEWDYLHGRVGAPCPSTEMLLRETDESDLACVMADHFAKPSVSPPFLRLVEPAVAFLQEGRRVEAAALFEAQLQLEPNHVDLTNNLGFCLLPDDPLKALELFESAQKIGPNEILPWVNGVVSLVISGEKERAMETIFLLQEQHAEEIPKFSGWLWDVRSILNSSEPEATEVNDLGSYLTDILGMLRSPMESVQDGQEY